MERPKMICKNPICDVDYPHYHEDNSDIGSLPARAPWPERLSWQRSELNLPRGKANPYRLFQFGWFSSHSKFQLPWKLALDGAIGVEDLAALISWKFAFSAVYGVPIGGDRLAAELQKYTEPNYPTLIVDDVLITGNSIEELRRKLDLKPPKVFGVVITARGKCPNWVFPILQVNEFFQSRATGLG